MISDEEIEWRVEVSNAELWEGNRAATWRLNLYDKVLKDTGSHEIAISCYISLAKEHAAIVKTAFGLPADADCEAIYVCLPPPVRLTALGYQCGACGSTWAPVELFYDNCPFCGVSLYSPTKRFVF